MPPPTPKDLHSHNHTQTHDGVDTCGDRLAQLILERTAQLRAEGHRVVKFSIVSYSLGGLISRYGYVESSWVGPGQ